MKIYQVYGERSERITLEFPCVKNKILSIFFKYAGQLELLGHLLPIVNIVKFVQMLNSKLGYHLKRQNAREMTFRQFTEQE